jgi:Fur family transcriptional regulator, ferric uptake regulator
MLERADIFLGARDLRDRLREVGEGVGLSTVYRIVHELAATGAVDVVTDENGECLYRLRPEGEHHHFILCRACGRGVEISSAALEAWLAEVADRHGFGELTHRLDVFGICDVCQSPTGLP